MNVSIKICLLALLTTLAGVTGVGQVRFDGKYPASDSLTCSWLITVPAGEFGGSHLATVQPDDSVEWVTVDGVAVTDTVRLSIPTSNATHALQYSIGGVVHERTLQFTSLPTVQLLGKIHRAYMDGMMLIDQPGATRVDTMLVSFRWAGSSTIRSRYHKHHYHIKLIDQEGNKVDRSLFGLRNDNHWRMDAGLIDMGRVRNYVANTLWADMNATPYYIDRQSGARTYVRGTHVEVFLNGEYRGFYNFAEHMDRKQLKLKKYDDAAGEFHGMLWKGKNETNSTMFIEAADIDNTLDTWDGFNLQYPDIADVNPTRWDVLHDAVDFVATSSDADFRAHAGEYLDLPALASYYVFINVLLAIDNSCKNLLWACYDQAVSPMLTPVVWDLDATVGQHWSDIDACYRIPQIGPENELTQVSKLGNSRLFTRLMQWAPFRQQVIDRYWALRPTVLDADSLVARYMGVLDRLDSCGALQREAQRWSGDSDIANRNLDFDDERQYISDWLRRRIAYLDTHTFARPTGDVNADGEVTVADVNLVIDLILTGDYLPAADVNADNEVTVADVNALIDLILTTSNP